MTKEEQINTLKAIIQECEEYQWQRKETLYEIIKVLEQGLTPNVLADALMEERIRGKLDSDTIFEKDIIRDVKCRLTVSIIDHRPCYCGAGLREVWRESEETNANKH